MDDRDDPHRSAAGNRFGSYGFGAGLSGLLLAVTPFGDVLAAALLLAGVVLGVIGFAHYAEGEATNRDTSVVGVVTGGIGLVVLFVEASLALTVPMEPWYWMP